MRYQDVYNKGLKELEKSNIDSFIFENNVIFEYVFKIKFHELCFYEDDILEEAKIKCYFGFIEKRANGYPLQYIVGIWGFYNLDFVVGKGVLIPRQDTETLVACSLEICFEKPPVVYDLCAGTGCIGITIEKNMNTQDVFLIEKFKDAFYYLMINKNLNKSNAKLLLGDIFVMVDKIENESIDLVVSNPPYISFKDYAKTSKEVMEEPSTALLAKEDGLLFYKKISKLYYQKIKYGGYIVFEIGYNQALQVVEILNSCGYKKIEVIKDLTGNDRVVKCEK